MAAGFGKYNNPKACSKYIFEYSIQNVFQYKYHSRLKISQVNGKCICLFYLKLRYNLLKNSHGKKKLKRVSVHFPFSVCINKIKLFDLRATIYSQIVDYASNPEYGNPADAEKGYV